MESTKSIAIATVTGLMLVVLPAKAQDGPRANTAVQLAEHVRGDRPVDGYPLDDTATDDIATDDTATDEANNDAQSRRITTEQLTAAKFTAEQGEIPAITQVETGAGAEAAEAGGVLEEEAFIPRGRTFEASGDLTPTAQLDVPWYRGPFVALLAVLGLIGLVAASFRRWVPSARAVNSDQLSVVGRTVISSKQSVVLLHVGKRIVLLGVTADAVNTLSEITDEAEVALLLGRAKSADSEASGFNAVLAREYEQYEEAETSPAHLDSSDASLTDVADTAALVTVDVPVAVTEPKTERGTQASKKKPSQMHDLLARLRALQKS